MKKQIILIECKNGRISQRNFAPGKNAKSNAAVFMVIVHQVTGTIDWPTSLQGKKDKGADIVEKCNSSTYITFGTGIVAIFEGTVTAFDHSTSLTHDATFITMNNGAQTLLGIVKPIADASPALAAAIYASCGFGIKGFGGNTIKEFNVTNGTQEGSVDFITAAGPEGKRHLHLWYSSNDGVTFIIAGATNNQINTIGGYEATKYMYFMTELSIQDVLQGRSQIIKILIK
jgi:hypothetical protein